MELLFRQIEQNEINKVLNLFKEAAEKIAKKNIDHWQYWKNPPAEKIKWVEQGILDNEFFFILNSIGETIGMVRILEEDLPYWGQKNDHANYVHSLVVIEKFEGKGIGGKILQEIEYQAVKKGAEFLRLDCDAKNQKLCAYYEHQGFKQVGTKITSQFTFNLYQKNIINSSNSK